MAKRLIKFLLVSFLLSTACFSQGIFITDLPEAQLEDISTPDLLLLVDLDEVDPNDQAKKMTLENFQLFLAETFSGGGLDKWVAATEYEIDDVVWLEDDNKIYRATADHTSGSSFNPSNWQELSEQPDVSDFVEGPASSVARQVPVFSDTTGKKIEDSELVLPSVVDTVALATSTTDGSDDYAMTLTPAGGLGSSRGSWFALYGNEHSAKPGDIAFSLGGASDADFDLSNGSASIFNINSLGKFTIGDAGNTQTHEVNGAGTEFIDASGLSTTISGNTISVESGGGDASLTLQHQPGGDVIQSDGAISTTLGRNENDVNIMNDGSFEIGDGELTCTNCTLSVVPTFSPTFKNRYAIRASFSASTGKVCYTKTSGDYESHKLSAAITVVNSASNGIYFRAQRNGTNITGIEQHIKVSATPERYVLPQFIGGSTSLGWCIEATEAITADIDFDNAFIGAGEAEVIRDYFDVVETKYLSADVTTVSTLSDLTFSNLEVGSDYEVVISPKFQMGGSGNITLSVNHNSSIINQAFYSHSAATSLITAPSLVTKFTASSSTLTFSIDAISTGVLAGNGTPVKTFAQLIHKKSGQYLNSTTTQQAGEIYFNGNDSCRPGDVGFGEEISRTDYPELFAKWGERFGEGDGSTTFMTPPRGYFLRVADEGAGNDPDAATRIACATGGVAGDNIGSCQADAFQGHTHGYGNTSRVVGGGVQNLAMWTDSTTPVPAVSDGVNGTPRTSSETRSKNIAMRGCIVARTARVVAELTETVKYDGSEMLDRERIDNGDGTTSQVYKRCFKIVSDITSQTVIATIPSGLNVMGAPTAAVASPTKSILAPAHVASGANYASVTYDSSNGNVSCEIGGSSFKCRGGTNFCMRYTK